MGSLRRSSSAALSSLEEESSPLVDQWLVKDHKSRSWKKSVVYDPTKNSVEIKKRDDLENDLSRYMSCRLPLDRSRLSLFLDSTESKAFAVSKAPKGEGNIFIGVLNMERLGIMVQILRCCGNLRMLYIVRYCPLKWEPT